MLIFLSSFLLFSCQKNDTSIAKKSNDISQITPSDSANFKQLIFKQFGTKDGLLSTQVWNVFHDKFGYTWVATNEGVSRYDGYNFYSYYDDLKRNVHLKMASQFFEDSDGTLWVLSGAGFLNKFNRNADRFEYIKTPFENGWVEQGTHTILEDSSKNLWLGAYGGLQYFDRQKDTIIAYPISKIRDPSWQHEEKLRFGKIVQDKRGNFWIGTRKFGLVKFDIQTKKYHLFRYDKEYFSKLLLSDWITDIIPLEDGTMLISEWDVGIIHWDIEHEKILNIIKVKNLLKSKNKVLIRDMFLEDKKFLWLGTDTDGLIVLDISRNKVIAQYQHDFANKSGISGSKVRHISRDYNGNYWLSANTLEIASSKFSHFNDFFNEISDTKSLRDNNIFSLSATPEGKILTSTNKGLSVFNPATRTFDNDYNFITENPQSYATFAASDGSIWLGFKDKTVHFDPKTKKIIHEYAATLTTDNNVNFLKRACKIMEDSRGIIWTINHWGRVNFIDPKTHKLGTIPELSQDFELNKFVNALGFIDDPIHHQLIVCMDLGIATIDYQNNKVEKKKIHFEDLDLTKSLISYIYKDKTENIWIIAEGLVYQLNTNDFSLKKLLFSKEDNNESFKWIVEEPKGIYWLSSFKGILKYESSSQKTTHYFTPNLGGITLDSPSPVIQSDGKIYFGGFNGLSVFEPEKFVESNAIPQINIESLSFSSNKDTRTQLDSTVLLYEKSKIFLDYFQNKISIKYVGINSANQSSIKYAYKLEGYDKDWVQADNIREVVYTNLSPKIYQFSVKASGNDINWSKDATLNIIIYPPFWQTWWAILLYLALISAMIYFFIKFRVRSRLQKIKELEEVRIRISSNLHDDVGTILSGLAMQSEMLALTSNKEQKEALYELRNMSHDAMERMRDTVWAIDSRKDKYENLIDKMRDFAEKNLNLKYIRHTFKIEIDDPKKFIDPATRQNIYLIFKEAITNICKHSDAQNVTILFKQEKNSLYLLVHDDGNKKYMNNSDGVGLHNMTMRAKKTNAILKINYSSGFKVELEMNL